VEAQPPLLGELFAIRVQIAASRYDMPAVIDLAQSALSVVPPEAASPRSRILLSLGVAHHEIGGDLDAAKNAFREAFAVCQAVTSVSSVGNAPLPLTALAYLAEIEWLQGNLRESGRMYKQAAELATHLGGQPSIALCLVHWGRASVLYEWDDLEGAAVAVEESIRVAELWRTPRLLVPAYGLSALVMQARSQAMEAREAIRRAEHAAGDAQASLFILGLLGVYDLGLSIAKQDWGSLARWQQHFDSEWPSQLSRVRAALATALTRAWIARYYHRREAAALHHAQALLAPTMERTKLQGLQFNTTRLLIAESLVLYAQGDSDSAVASLRRALSLAEPENYARSFLDLGKPMEDLLHRSLENHTLREPRLRQYVEQLVSRFAMDLPTKTGPPGGEALIEPLTEREMEVLRLIAEGLSNREISERLFLALSTVKGHTRIIFDKLQVQRRTEAVARARDLGLLWPPPRLAGEPGIDAARKPGRKTPESQSPR
jgi:LuxR family maltose regulon positive regulatory protein